jgi:hypothetical protein
VNLYIAVEGEVGEIQVYRSWVPLVNPALSYVDHISEIRDNNFYIVSGGGYPNYFEVIDAAIQDVNNLNNIDRLVIAVDSEELSYEEKLTEMETHLAESHCSSQVKVIVQHFCLETWALGNQKAVPKHPHNGALHRYMHFYNVRSKDPALLTGYEVENLNRCQFAEKYLRRALNEKYKNLTYSKSNPTALLHHKYFERVQYRLSHTGHIESFRNFLQAFV